MKLTARVDFWAFLMKIIFTLLIIFMTYRIWSRGLHAELRVMRQCLLRLVGRWHEEAETQTEGPQRFVDLSDEYSQAETQTEGPQRFGSALRLFAPVILEGFHGLISGPY